MKEETNKRVSKHISITKKCGIWWIFEENEHGKQISDSIEIENKVDQTNWRMDDLLGKCSQG